MSTSVPMYRAPVRPSGSFVMNAGDVQAQGLQYWWPCNTVYDHRSASSPITVYDMMQRSHGSGGSNSRFTSDPVFGNCVYLKPTTSTDYSFVITLGSCPLISGQDFTFSFWAARSSGTSGGRWWGVAGSSCAVSLWTDGKIYYDTPRIISSTTTGTVWNHICFQSKADQAKSYIYMNGDIVATNASAAFATINSGGGNFTFGRRNNAIGGGGDNAAPGTNIVGLGCDIRMYCPSLPDGAIREMYNPSTRWSLYYIPRIKSYFLPSTPSTDTFPSYHNVSKYTDIVEEIIYQ